MACASQSMISASSYALPSYTSFGRSRRIKSRPFSVFASSDDSDCNVEECAPDKEVGKVSMEWLAGEKTKVAGTFPPRKKGWTGYVEKDTAGQTNIYSVEPAIYVAESAISSGTSGTSSEGSGNTAAIAAGLALISIATASTILLQLSKNTPQIQTSDYSGPPLSYYINKFKPNDTVEASVPSEPQTLTVEASVPPESQTSSTIEASASPEPQISSEFQSNSNEMSVPEVQMKLNMIVGTDQILTSAS
ncbi:hypothetical protein J5N97_012785 [Dioscorea zingiberensis]|uniref:Protein MAINTENANCE OF PSII UNDER HIGH LIGHT 1 n=1 Tax=Dioscorea zingiberensis TaxID=325984 RepID=A0A9D5HI16_9LILI|nr:hypothetical protein J5N97_012785 [Dioscorea zingiberensis]